MNENLNIYNDLRNVPDQAKKTINGGRLNGMTDVNPMWRIKVLTEQFGPCGFGWKYEITRQWAETYGNETKAFANINLFIKVNGEWSDAIPGTGGSTLVEAKGYVNDEAYKMALTDALSVSMKALGVAADIYYQKDADYGTKYEKLTPAKDVKKTTAQAPAQGQEKKEDVPFTAVFASIRKAMDRDSLKKIWDENPTMHGDSTFRTAVNYRKKELNIA